MATYIYDGIAIQMAQTLEFTAEPEYDPSGTDMLWVKYTIQVRGFVASSEAKAPGVGDSLKTALTYSTLKARLESPRRQMLYRIGDTDLVTVGTVPFAPNASGPGMDDKLGPHPLPCRITTPNSGTFMVECGCIVRLVNCPPQCPQGQSRINPNVVSLRWTQTESFDQNWYSRLKTKGKLIVRSSLLQSADNFRALTVPGLLNDYQRMSSTYTLSPDGLELDFEYEDLEVAFLPPIGATKASGSYTSRVEQPGVNRFGTVQITLEGKKGTSRRLLMNRALAIAYQKLRSEGFAKNPKTDLPTPIVWGDYSEDFFAAKISVTMTARLQPAVHTLEDLKASPPGVGGVIRAGLALVLGAGGPPAVIPTVGADIPEIPANRVPIKPPDRSRLPALIAAAFLDPCACGTTTATLRGSRNPPTFITNPAILSTTPLYSISVGPTSPPTSPPVAEVLTDGPPYTTTYIENTTNFDSGLVQLPGTGTGPTPRTTAIVSAHGGMATMTSAWVVTRTGTAPPLPTYQSPNSNLVPLYGTVVAKEVNLDATGDNLTYSVAGYYVYAILDILQYQITAAVPQYLSTQLNDAALASTKFWTDDPVWGPQSAGQSGANPFIEGGVTPGIPPQAPQQFQSAGIQTFADNGSQQSGNQGTTFQQTVGP